MVFKEWEERELEIRWVVGIFVITRLCYEVKCEFFSDIIIVKGVFRIVLLIYMNVNFYLEFKRWRKM